VPLLNVCILQTIIAGNLSLRHSNEMNETRSWTSLSYCTH